MVMAKSFDKDFQFSYFGYYFVFSWLRFKHSFFDLTNKIFSRKDVRQV